MSLIRSYDMGQRTQSLTLAGIMFLSVLAGMLMFDLDSTTEEPPNIKPSIAGDSGKTFQAGQESRVMLLVSDENLESVALEILIDGARTEGYTLTQNGEVWIEIPPDKRGVVLIEASVIDDEGLSDDWAGTFTVSAASPVLVIGDPIPAEEGEKLVFGGTIFFEDISTCTARWEELGGSGGSLPIELFDDGRFIHEIDGEVGAVTIRVIANCGSDTTQTEFLATWLESDNAGCTDPAASNYDSSSQTDDGSCEYTSDNDGDGTNDDQDLCEGHDDSADADGDGIPDGCDNASSKYNTSDMLEFWLDKFLCQNNSGLEVDDYNTTGHDAHVCSVGLSSEDGNITITMNGLPNHDFESGPGCCASPQSHVITIPRAPANDTQGGHDPANCPEAAGSYQCAADRGNIAFAINGVPIFGPEDGPGGDAVASQHGAYEEDRQEIWLGLCHGHSGPGGTYHYHADANCVHWHDEAQNEGWRNYSFPPDQSGEPSPVIGVALDGYPIYGAYGLDSSGVVAEMKSSYRLKEGQTGYNGIDDYEYVEGLGDLDVCNGHFGPTPDFPEGIYHYHSTMKNGDGEMGFPYFLICYHGLVPEGDSDPCDGYGETWGPGVGPPPEGCDPGPPQGQESLSTIGLLGPLKPPIIGLIGLLWLLIRPSNLFRGWASWIVPSGRADTTRVCLPTQG